MKPRGKRFSSSKKEKKKQPQPISEESAKKETDAPDESVSDPVDEDFLKKYDATPLDAESETIKEASIDDEDDEDVREFRKKQAMKERERDERKKKKNDEKLEKIIKKRQKRDKHSKRKVTSYEEMPIEERPDQKTAPKKKRKFNVKRITAVVIILLLLVAAVFLFANSDSFSFTSMRNFVDYGILNHAAEERFPLDIQGENISNGNFTRMGKDLCYTSDTKFAVVNNYGVTTFSTQNGFSDPVLVCGNERALVYNLGGTGFQINSKEATIFDSTMDNNILVADIADNGNYALVTEYDGYLAKLFLYNNKNELIYAYSFADYYVTSISLNSSGMQVVVGGVSAVEGTQTCAVYVLDVRKDEPIVFAEKPDNILYAVKFLNDNYVCAIGSDAVYGVKVSNGEVNETSYGARTLTAFDINADTKTFSVSLSKSGDGRNCDILSFSSNGSLNSTFQSHLKVESLSTFKNRVAALSEGKAYLFSKDGRQLSEKEAGMDPHVLVLYSKADAYVLSNNEINRLDL